MLANEIRDEFLTEYTTPFSLYYYCSFFSVHKEFFSEQTANCWGLSGEGKVRGALSAIVNRRVGARNANEKLGWIYDILSERGTVFCGK